jgi:asparagine synthase (glutamine-hydrolysing)
LDDHSDCGDADFLLELYLRRQGWDFLPKLDGVFAMALFDAADRELTLVSDRLGYRPLYYWSSPDVFAFASEVKSIAALPERPAKVDRLGMEEFFANGHMLDDRTWIEDIRVLGPGTRMTVKESAVSQTSYWSWQEVEPQSPDLSLDAAMEEAASLWRRAVASRMHTKHRYSLQLSGGLDSRSILAAIPKEQLPVLCVTMGVARCEDIKIASQVAKIRGCPHVVVELDKIDDFLVKREPFVWLTDGMVSILHLHASAMAGILRAESDFSFNGFVGEAVLGGSYTTVDLSPQEHLIKKYASNPLMTGFDSHGHIVREWQRTGMSLEWFSLYLRARRFTIMGTVQLSAHIEQRKPFIARDLLLFGMSLPQEYHDHSLLYGKMLLANYPELYKGVPWQKIGVPVDAGALRKRLVAEGRLLSRRINYVSPALGSHLPQFQMVDYASMLRTPEAQSYVTRWLLSADTRVREFVPENEIQRLCEMHFRKRADTHQLIARLLTAEIYLAHSGL